MTTTIHDDLTKCSEHRAMLRNKHNAVLKAVKQNDKMETTIYREALFNAADSKMKWQYVNGAITLPEYLSWESNHY